MNRKQNAITNRKYTKVAIKQIEHESLISIRIENHRKILDFSAYYNSRPIREREFFHMLLKRISKHPDKL